MLSNAKWENLQVFPGVYKSVFSNAKWEILQEILQVFPGVNKVSVV